MHPPMEGAAGCNRLASGREASTRPLRLRQDGPCADNIKLDHLEEIKLENFSGLDDQVEFVKLLLRCNLPLLGRVVFSIPSSCLKETQQIIRNKIYSTLCQDKMEEVRSRLINGFFDTGESAMADNGATTSSCITIITAITTLTAFLFPAPI
ncbi:hypothetical protein ABZP36_009709 [Zizania latifolia]